MLKGDFVYRNPGAEPTTHNNGAGQFQQLRQRATRISFALVSHETGEVTRRLVSWESPSDGRAGGQPLVNTAALGPSRWRGGRYA